MAYDIPAEVQQFADRIKSFGFTVYVAERGTYGFITDDTENRVLSFSFTDGGSLGGNYGPPSTQDGTGWRMDHSPWDLKSHADVLEALYAPVPSWIGRGQRPAWKYLSTVAQYLAQYGSSSRFTKV